MFSFKNMHVMIFAIKCTFRDFGIYDFVFFSKFPPEFASRFRLILYHGDSDNNSSENNSLITDPQNKTKSNQYTSVCQTTDQENSVTLGNVCALQWRLLSTTEAVQYSGGRESVQWMAYISTVEG